MAKHQGSFASFGKIPMALAALGFLIATALSIFLVQSGVNSAHRSTLGQVLAKEIAQQINIKESLIKTQLLKIATSRLVLDGIDGSSANLIATETSIASLIPFAERVQLIPIGQAKTDQGYPPFNYTALDLVKRVEAAETVAPEAISSKPQLEGDKWVIVATPIKNRNGLLKGTLFVYLNLTSISGGVTDGSTGEVRIMQNVGTTPKTIAVTGGSGSEAVYLQALNNPNWTIQFSPSASLATSSPLGLVIYVIPGLVMLLVTLAGIYYATGQTAKTVQLNLSRLGGQIARVAKGNYEGEANYSLPGFADQDSKLKQFIDRSPAMDKGPTGADPVKKASPKKAVIDIEMVDEEQEVEVSDDETIVDEPSKPATDISEVKHIFRAYDIRGVVGESLSEDISRQIGLAIGSEAAERGEQTLLVGYDGREYSPALAEALIDGITASGANVINIGAVPTPVLYYATHNSDTRSGVMVTGGHNPPDDNGFKIVLDGNTLIDTEINSLFERIQNNNFSLGEGSESTADFTQDYMDAIADDVVVAKQLKVVIDCANGIAGSIAPELLDLLGCEAVPLYCEVDGSFPNHPPDPTNLENLEDLVLTVQSQGADLGIGLDGDGDRLVAVTAEGEIIMPDRLLMLFAKDIVSRNPGADVVYDVKCTRHLNSVISGFGGRPILCRSGHTYIKQKINETGAMLGGELAGHICFSERWFGFDDGLYSAARLLEIVGSQEAGLSELLKEFPLSVITPEIRISVEDDKKFALVESLVAAADFEDASLTTVDGLRIDFADGWGLIRASNTEAALTLRFEADNQESLDDIKAAFRELLQEVQKDLDFE